MTLSERIATSFAKQSLMVTLGAELVSVAPGDVRIGLPIAPHLSQQKGFVHGAVAFAIGDSAAGYAAVTVLDPPCDVLTSEMSIHYLAPATGERLIARGSVIKPGRRLVVTQADIFVVRSGEEHHVARMSGTMIPVPIST